MKIIYLPQNKIDKEKWNAAVDRAANGQIYAYAWYLDCVTEKWDALISEDYTYIMPLPWNAKWLGVKQVYQPFFVQQLGIFGAENPSAEVVNLFLNAVPKHFKYIYTQLNEENPIGELVDFAVKSRCNMLLNLSESYENLHQNFRPTLRHCIRKAKKKLTFSDAHLDVETFIDFCKTNLPAQIGLSDTEYLTLKNIISTAQKKQKGHLFSVHSEDKTCIAVAFFLESHGRLVQLFTATSPIGRKANANHFLINSVIESNAESEKVLDFEGSEIPSIAKFFRGFNPREVMYHQIIKDEFPFWIKKLRNLKQR